MKSNQKMNHIRKIDSFRELDNERQRRRTSRHALSPSSSPRIKLDPLSSSTFITAIPTAIVFVLVIINNNAVSCLSSGGYGNFSRSPSVMSPSSDRAYVIKSPAAPSYESTKDTMANFRQIFDNLTIHVKENTPLRSVLADFRADDPRGDEDPMRYRIVGGPDASLFNVTVDRYADKWELINMVELDYESPKKSYYIIVRGLSLYLRYEVSIDIFVDDENDNKPQLDDFSVVFNNYKNHLPNLSVGKVPANDADITDQSRLRYRVVAGNNARLVVVNETSGEIQLSPWLDSNVPLKAIIMVAVSDGLHEVVANMVLKVNLVTEAMLQNTVVLRLDGIGRQEFLSRKYEEFLNQMVRMLSPQALYGTNNIVVLNVEESMVEITHDSPLVYRAHHGSTIENSTLSVNVSFAARATDGNDLELYLNRPFIEERIFIHREALSQALDLVVFLPNNDNPCAQSPCQEYQECQATHRFDNAPKMFINTKNMMFRPIKAVQSYLCSCRPVPDAGSSSGSNSSVCGPCNCDTSKGYSGECDRETGHCYCKPYHFKPQGSDFCLACDCYGDGSLGLTCNQTTTGQCKCRPGVVGRRCDTCSSPYAEVTLRGCEVIYDACPKTFSDGIWWDRTPLDKMAIQQCPSSTSTGTATRFCHKSEGWLKPNLFDCISNTFTYLHNQYQVLEEKKFTLASDTAIKIAGDLRFALNETITNPALQLYGSDMYIGFRLIHHLIRYESQQTGLNLTHRRDRLYVRNIAESINNLLDPKYAGNWPEIAARSPNGGAEYLLKLVDTYGRVLIESQSDTFTQPFEISTKYFTFGMDTLSAEQLFDLTRTPTGFGLDQQGPSPPYATYPYPSSTGSLNLTGAEHLSPGGLPELLDTRQQQQQQQFGPDGSSVYLDYSLKGDASPAIAIPKYDNYPAHDQAADHDSITKVLLPLKTIRIKSLQELISQANFTARSRAKRDDNLEIKYLKQQQQSPTQQQLALVVYSIYRSLGSLLPNSFDNTVPHRLGATVSPNSPIVWLTIRPANSSDFIQKNIQPKITYMLKINQPEGMIRPQCAVWNFNSQTNAGALTTTNNKSSSSATYGIKPTGRFTTKGCEIRGIHPNNRLKFRYDYVNCSCDQLGAVTVLMDSANYASLASSDELSNFKDFALSLALCVSLIIMGAIYVVLSFVRGHSIKSNSNSINKNLIFILILIELLILYSEYSRSSLGSQREYQCKLVAIFLHYLSISLFFWLLVNAIHFYRMLTELRDINHGPMKFYHIIGYAIPAFFVSIAVGLRIEQFGNYLFCWLSIHEPIIWSMFGPIGIVAFFACLIMIMAFCKTLKSVDGQDGQQVDDSISGAGGGGCVTGGAELLKNHMLINMIKTPLIGFYWLLTVFAINETISESVFYLFPAIVIIKSVVLFVLLCVIDKHIRYNLYVSWLRMRGDKAPFLEDTANYLTTSQNHSGSWMINQSGDPLGNKHQLYAGYGGQPLTPGFQSSCTDIFRPEVLAGLSATSTTSRSSMTGGSSSQAYQYQQYRHSRGGGGLDDSYGRTGRKHRRRHKKSHHKHHHHRHHHHHHHHRSRHHDDADYGEDQYQADHRRRHESRNSVEPAHTNESQSLNELASSHSSDDDMSIMPRRDHIANSEPQQQQQDELTNENVIVVAGDQQQTVPMELHESASGLKVSPAKVSTDDTCLQNEMQAQSSNT